jgi:hypothetical protein
VKSDFPGFVDGIVIFEERRDGKKRRYLAGFAGVCWHLWAVVDDFRVFLAFGRDRGGSSVFVGEVRHLWTILGFDACSFGFCAGFVG